MKMVERYSKSIDTQRGVEYYPKDLLLELMLKEYHSSQTGKVGILMLTNS